MESYIINLYIKKSHVKFLFEASLGVGVLIVMNRKAQLILKLITYIFTYEISFEVNNFRESASL